MEGLTESIESSSNADSAEEQDSDEEGGNRQGSDRLCGLQRTLSEHSDDACSGQDYSHVTESVKHFQNVNCLQDTEDLDNIDNDALFSYENFKQRDLAHPCCCDKGETYQRTDDEVADYSSGISDLTEHLTEADVSKSTDVSSRISTKLEDLRTFGHAIGYPGDVVSKTLDFVDETTRYSDFIAMLYRVEDSQPAEKVEIVDDKNDDIQETDSGGDDD